MTQVIIEVKHYERPMDIDGGWCKKDSVLIGSLY